MLPLAPGDDLLADLASADHQCDAHTEQDHHEASPGNEALGPQLVGVTAVSPLVGGVDGRVAVDVGAILVLEPVDSVALLT